MGVTVPMRRWSLGSSNLNNVKLCETQICILWWCINDMIRTEMLEYVLKVCQSGCKCMIVLRVTHSDFLAEPGWHMMDHIGNIFWRQLWGMRIHEPIFPVQCTVPCRTGLHPVKVIETCVEWPSLCITMTRSWFRLLGSDIARGQLQPAFQRFVQSWNHQTRSNFNGRLWQKTIVHANDREGSATSASSFHHKREFRWVIPISPKCT